MKKVSLFLAMSAFTLFTMTSCKKTYHCECTSGGITTKGASVTMNKKDSDTSKAACESATGGISCKWVTE